MSKLIGEEKKKKVFSKKVFLYKCKYTCRTIWQKKKRRVEKKKKVTFASKYLRKEFESYDGFLVKMIKIRA